MAKQIIIEDQAAPKTQPGGVQGAFAKFWYQTDETPFPVKELPIARPTKLRNKKNTILLNIKF